MTEETLLEFPCRFPIKIMTRAEVDLQPLITKLVVPHAGEINAADINMRPSKNGNFISVTVTVNATSKAQLDTIYQALTDSEDVLMSL